MKRTIVLILCLMLCIGTVACGGKSEVPTETASAPAQEVSTEPVIEYYADSNVPTLDSVLGEPVLPSKSEDVHLYGTYETEDEAVDMMKLYVAALQTQGFTLTETSVAYELSNGTHKVTVVGGNYEGKLAICVLVD